MFSDHNTPSAEGPASLPEPADTGADVCHADDTSGAGEFAQAPVQDPEQAFTHDGAYFHHEHNQSAAAENGGGSYVNYAEEVAPDMIASAVEQSVHENFDAAGIAIAPQVDVQAADHETMPASAGHDATQESEPAQAQATDDGLWTYREADVLSGRGASVNSHGGNKRFRALCFARKPEFLAGNHAAKRRIATEIVSETIESTGARFLKKKDDKGPWHEMTRDQAILKACQVMRDYKRPDRVASRELATQCGAIRRRHRLQESTPMDNTPVIAGPVAPIIENPFGVHDHDVLSGRGAFINGHIGNQRLRDLAMARKAQFDAASYTDKRILATEIVQIIKSLEPSGRFLKRRKKEAASDVKLTPEQEFESEWEELSDDKAVHKACQVMRDIDRKDRKDREERKLKRIRKKEEKRAAMAQARSGMVHMGIGQQDAIGQNLMEHDHQPDTSVPGVVVHFHPLSEPMQQHNAASNIYAQGSAADTHANEYSMRAFSLPDKEGIDGDNSEVQGEPQLRLEEGDEHAVSASFAMFSSSTADEHALEEAVAAATEEALGNNAVGDSTLGAHQ